MTIEPEADQLPGTSLTRLPRAAVLAAGDARLRASLLGDYLDVLADAAGGGRRLRSAELERFRSLGRAAAEAGASLRALVDLYLSATWRAWPSLPAVQGAGDTRALRTVGTAVLRASDDVVAALCEGYESARAARARSEEAARRELVDDLLTGTSDVASLIDRAAGFGLRLEAPHIVLVGRASRRFVDGRAVTPQVEAALRASRPGPADLLVATKDGLLVCVVPAGSAPLPEPPFGPARPFGPVPTEPGPGARPVAVVVDRLGREADLEWRLGVSRARRGAAGVRAGFEEARSAIDVAARLGRPDPVARAESLLIYQVLLRDRPALEELVATVLAGLLGARGGAEPLLETLRAYLDAGAVTLAAARGLHLSPRAVTYRLARIAELTGYDPTDPDDRYILQTAAVGARLISWPARPVGGGRQA